MTATTTALLARLYAAAAGPDRCDATAAVVLGSPPETLAAAYAEACRAASVMAWVVGQAPALVALGASAPREAKRRWDATRALMGAASEEASWAAERARALAGRAG